MSRRMPNGRWELGACGRVFERRDGKIIAICTVRSDEDHEWIPRAKLIAAAPLLLEACQSAIRLPLLRCELSENYARLKGAGRTTSAESSLIAKSRIASIRTEIREIESSINAAISAAEKGGPE